MTDAAPLEADRYDVVVVGAGAAGLSAALVLGRGRRRTLVLDGGPPRNAPSHASHGFLTRDGTPPLELLRLAHEDLTPYDSVEVRLAVASDARIDDGDPSGGFEVVLDSGEVIRTRLVLLASGVHDVLPEVPGLADLWGSAVFQCPYCDGWELRDRALGLLGSWRTMFARAALLRGWSHNLTAFINDPSDEAIPEIERLRALGVTVRTGAIASLERSADGVRVALDGGAVDLAVDLAGLFINPAQEDASGLASALSCMPIEGASGFTAYPRTLSSGETTTTGVFVAGDLLGGQQSVAVAVGTGARAAQFMLHALAMADAERVLAESDASGGASRT